MFVLLFAAWAQVATVNGTDIPDEAWTLAAQRGVGPLTDEGRLDVVQTLVAEELLYQEAVRLGYDRDPKVDKVLVNTLLRQEVYSTVRNGDFDDEELLAWYEAHRSEFNVPAKRQVKTITLLVDEDLTEKAAAARLERLREDLNAGDVEWKDTATAWSEDVYARRGGDLGFVTVEGKVGVDPAVIAVAFELPLDTISDPVRTEEGWALVLVANERAELERSFEQVKGSVLRKAKNEALAALYDDYVAGLAKRASVRVDKTWAREHGLPDHAKAVRKLGTMAEVDGVVIGLTVSKDKTPLEQLERAIADELLLAEALRQGLGSDPKVKKVIVNTYLREFVYDRVRNEDFTDEELRAYYEANKDAFTVPFKVHINMLTVLFGEERTREEARVLAEGYLAEVPARPFKGLATEVSEDPYRRRGGDVGWVSAQGKPGLDPQVVETALEQRDGDFTLVELDDRFVVVVRQGHREGVERTFEQMRGSVLRKVKNERIGELYDEHIDALAAQAEVVVHSEHVMALEAPKRTQRPALMPAPGASGPKLPPMKE
jgi:peptidyl-prolyl cis-trans isomerase C